MSASGRAKNPIDPPEDPRQMKMGREELQGETDGGKAQKVVESGKQ